MRTFMPLVAVILGFTGGPAGWATETAPKPNFVVFLADDEGYGELGCQGNPQIPTPHIDSIAAAGVRFTQGYVSGPYCSPTRAGLMTGRYQTRFGHEWNGRGPEFGLPVTETTMADRLRALGYATCAVGKWHLGESDRFVATRRGFDEFFGTRGNTPFFHPTIIDTRASLVGVPVTDDRFYTTEAYADRACEWLETHRDQPFFLYLPFNAQHAPLEAPRKYYDRFPHIADHKRRMFAAVMAAKDDAVGRVLATLRKIGSDDNTLVVYLSDNGGPTAKTTSSNGPLRGFKAETWEGGVRVPFMMRWNGALPAGRVYDHPVIQLDLLPTFLAAAGGEVSPDWKLDGVNLLPYLRGENPSQPHETLFWRFGKQMAIRHGDWKLVRGEGISEPALFNLATDIGEQRDLTVAEPAIARKLQTLWDDWNAEQIPPRWPKSKPTAEPDAAAKTAAEGPFAFERSDEGVLITENGRRDAVLGSAVVRKQYFYLLR